MPHLKPEISSSSQNNLLLKIKQGGKTAIIILIFFSFCVSGIYGQTATDSLQTALKETRGVHRAELLLELSNHTRQKNMNKAIIQVKEALTIAEQHDIEELQAKSMSRLAWFYSIVNRDTTALEYHLSALKMERQHGHLLSEARILSELGRFYNGQGNHPKALNYYFQALRIYQERGKKSKAARTLVKIGRVYDTRKKFKEAITFYREAFVLAKSAKNFNEMTFAASGTAYAFKELENFKKAIAFFEKALESAKNIKSKHRLHAQANILLGMSSVYQDQNFFEKAIELVRKQIQLARSNESRMLQAYGYENMAGLYEVQGNFERSNYFLNEAIILKDALGISYADVLNTLGQNYIQQQQYSKAIKTGIRGLQQAKESGSIQDVKMLLETLIQAYTLQENYQKAFLTQAELVAVNARIYNQGKAQQIAEMQTRYETQQKEQEIALLQKEQEKAELLRNALAAGLVLIIIIGFLIYNRQRLKIKKNRTDMENTRLKKQQLEQDIEFKNKQLATHSLHLVQKNEAMKELKQGIKDIQNNSNGKSDKKLRDLQHLVNYSFNLDKDWEDFKLYFEEVHTGFFDALKKHYPDLTSSELRLSALVKLNLTIKEIATILSISPDSVKTARYRLRKKLGMKTEENLTDFMMNIEKGIQETKK